MKKLVMLIFCLPNAFASTPTQPESPSSITVTHYRLTKEKETVPVKPDLNEPSSAMEQLCPSCNKKLEYHRPANTQRPSYQVSFVAVYGIGLLWPLVNSWLYGHTFNNDITFALVSLHMMTNKVFWAIDEDNHTC